MQSNQNFYSVIYPSLLPLCISHFPQLFDTPSLLLPLSLPLFSPPSHKHSQLPPIAVMETIFKNITGTSMILLQKLQSISSKNPEDLLQYLIKGR